MKNLKQTKLTFYRAGLIITNITVFSLVLFISGCSEEPKPTPPKPVKSIVLIEPDELSKSVFPGRAKAGREANLSFRVSGPLVKLSVKVGDKISKGSEVAQIDPNDFNVLLTNTKALRDIAKASYKRANADYSRLIHTQQEDPGATSQRAVDLALSARDSAKASLASTEATVQTAKNSLSYTSLKAPFDGEIVETYAENFETVLLKQAIVRILDPSQIEMIISVPENLIGYAKYVTEVIVSFDSLPGIEIIGQIKEVGHEATQATRTYPVTIGMGQPEKGQILPGMAGQAKIFAKLPKSLDAGIHVPSTALFTGIDKTKSYVWLIVDNKVTKREVHTGDLTQNGVIIRSGISSGDRIVSAGVNYLTDGQMIKLMKDQVVVK